MSTLEAKPRKVRILNPKLLPIAALLLVVLALLFLAAPLIRTGRPEYPAERGQFCPAGLTNGHVRRQHPPGHARERQQSWSAARRKPGPGRTMPPGGYGAAAAGRDDFLYFVMLLISLAAALGMLFTKRWGQVLAIIMGVLYGLFGLVSLLPLLFIRFVGAPNPVNLILGVVHLLLAVAVIVLASIPGKPASPALAAAFRRRLTQRRPARMECGQAAFLANNIIMVIPNFRIGVY